MKILHAFPDLSAESVAEKRRGDSKFASYVDLFFALELESLGHPHHILRELVTWASSGVDGWRDHFQMVWIDAGTIAAQVVQLHSKGNRTMQAFPIRFVGHHRPSPNPNTSITGIGDPQLPNPTPLFVHHVFRAAMLGLMAKCPVPVRAFGIPDPSFRDPARNNRSTLTTPTFTKSRGIRIWADHLTHHLEATSNAEI